MLTLITIRTPTIHLLDSEFSNILTPISIMPSSSLPPVNQNEKFNIDNAKKMIDVNTT